MNTKKLAALALVPTLSLAGFVGAVYAASSDTTTTTTKNITRSFEGGKPDRGMFTKDLAAVLGLSESSITARLAAGETVDAIITSSGKTKEEIFASLQAARESSMKAKLAEDVASGKLTQAQADELLTKMKNKEKNVPKGPHGHNDSKHHEALASALGLTTDALTSLIQSGKTLDEITQAQGLTKEQVHTKLEASRPKDENGNPLRPTRAPRTATTSTQ